MLPRSMSSTVCLVLALAAAGCDGGGGGDGGCTPFAHTVCESGRLVWLDSCGQTGTVAEDCPCGCAAGGAECRTDCGDVVGPADVGCAPHAGRRCFAAESLLAWFDACGAREETAEACACGCTEGAAQCTRCPDCEPLCAGRCCGDDGCEGVCPDACNRPDDTCDLLACTCIPCVPTACPLQGYECGTWDDGCGRVRSCGDCEPPLVCAADGVCRDDTEPACPTGRTSCPDGCVDLQEDPSNCHECGHACGPGQGCLSGACQDVPTGCPCPAGMYCDLNQGTCVVGCLADGDCAGGSICEDRRCVPGCRADADCGAGRICVGQACREGCRNDAQCGAPDQICEELACRTGCREDEDCGAGRICAHLLCTTGCRVDAECGAGRICDDQICRAGCRDESQCTGALVCDPSTLTCRCLADDHCGAGRICDGGACHEGCRNGAQCRAVGEDVCGDDLTCEDWGTRCQADDDCGGWLEYCDLDALRCTWNWFGCRGEGERCDPGDRNGCDDTEVVCSPVTLRCERLECPSGTCAAGLVCTDGTCGPPASCSAGGCPAGLTCVNDRCIVGPASCTGNAQCGNDLYLCGDIDHRCLPYWRFYCEPDFESCWSAALRCDPLVDRCVLR